jgi:hypothetical protein
MRPPSACFWLQCGRRGTSARRPTPGYQSQQTGAFACSASAHSKAGVRTQHVPRKKSPRASQDLGAVVASGKRRVRVSVSQARTSTPRPAVSTSWRAPTRYTDHGRRPAHRARAPAPRSTGRNPLRRNRPAGASWEAARSNTDATSAASHTLQRSRTTLATPGKTTGRRSPDQESPRMIGTTNGCVWLLVLWDT